MNDIELIEIDTKRDAPLTMSWINAPGGLEMLRLMGMIVPDNFKTSLEQETKTLQTIIDDQNEIAWMIELDGQVVGILEVHTVPFEGLPEPNISIIIGDASIRGRGVGTDSMNIAIQKVSSLGYRQIYARVLTHNKASLRMLNKLGFENLNKPYTDKDDLNWQNIKKYLR